MKYKLRPYILTTLFVSSLTIYSCADYFDNDNVYDSSEYICFNTELLDVTANVRTRSHDEHLMMESEDWPIEGTLSNRTRVAPTTSLSGTAGVIGYKDSETSPFTELNDNSFTFGYTTMAATGAPVAWSKVSGASTLHVFAYAPYNIVHGDNPPATINTSTATPTLTYTVPSTVASQIDLLAASADVASDSYGSSVPLTFNHALTAIRFKVDFECYVKSVSIQNVYGTGTYAIGGSWTPTGEPTSSYTVSFQDNGLHCVANGAITDGANTLMLIPQTCSSESAQVVLTYTETEGGEDKTLTASIKTHEWPAGKRINYTISKAGISYVYFDLAAGAVSITESNYSGYVYVNGVATHVTGTSPSDKKYYIYQSTTITGSNDKDHTGYAKSTDFDNKANIRIPSYADLTSGGKNWRQFITNNSDIASVIDGWTAATSGKRTGTNNTIKVNGNVTADITLDNVWCSFHDNSGHRTNGGIVIGPGTKSPSALRYEKVTLRLKGDNRFCNIYYYGHPNNQSDNGSRAYLHITSATGDGSYDGSLTVTVPSTDITLAGACTVLGSGDNDDCPPCNSLVFNGGTIFVAGSILVPSGDSSGILGGGTNNHCNLVINEAVITAVAYSNGAAIGGGGGHSSGGGSGTVTINGGKVYAYQYGTYDATRQLSTAAIGGGSSYGSEGSSGIVTINGGEVYAQSVGGVAIGGGSSYSVHGGAANVTITGGYVVAKSIAGKINGHDVEVSNAIGGGKGGNGAESGYGGSAHLTITGGTLLSGSVGGGGTISETAPIGTAEVNIGGTADVQGQFIMAKGASTSPTFSMTGGTLRKITSGAFQIVKPDGGAVYIEDGSFTMSGGVISGFSAAKGGAVYIEDGSFTMTGGTIENCTAEEYGGAIYVDGGTFTMSEGTIRSNRSNDSGGGVYVDNGTFSMSAGDIKDNYAVKNGGGVSVSSSSSDVNVAINVAITGGSITGNSAGEYGGGLSVVTDNERNAYVALGVANQGLLNPDISGNSATHAGGGVYAKGDRAFVTINSGKVNENIVSALVANPDIANDGGLVKLFDGDVSYVVVTYHMNDGCVPEETSTQKIVTATSCTLDPPDWPDHVSGFTFNGWNTRADGSGSYYTPDGNGVIKVTLTTGLNLYAIWTN